MLLTQVSDEDFDTWIAYFREMLRSLNRRVRPLGMVLDLDCTDYFRRGARIFMPVLTYRHGRYRAWRRIRPDSVLASRIENSMMEDHPETVLADIETELVLDRLE